MGRLCDDSFQNAERAGMESKATALMKIVDAPEKVIVKVTVPV